MKIYFFDVRKEEIGFIKKYFKDLAYETSGDSLSDKNIDKFKDAQIISISLNTNLTTKLISLLPNLKYIAARTTGFDNIDLNEAKKRQISVSNVPLYAQDSVAEYTFALILALSRKIIKSYEIVQKFLPVCRKELMGFDLKDKILGIIGIGNIGSNVARIAHGFEMNVIAYDLKPDKELAQKFHFKYLNSLESLLSQSDIITLHLPYNVHTHHLINKNTIKLIKPGALLINTSRGGLIDSEALIVALDNKIISGVGLDVLEKYIDLNFKFQEFIKELVSRDNVLLTGHNAYNTYEALARLIETTEQNIKSFINNHVINAVF